MRKPGSSLTHPDKGPRARYLGNEVPKEALIWQDPIPPVSHQLAADAEIDALKRKILSSGLTIPELVRTSWASAATFRGTDKRGGANGAEFAFHPKKTGRSTILPSWKKFFTSWKSFKPISTSLKRTVKVFLADMIVLGGSAAVEQAAKSAGYTVKIPFRPGRMDAGPGTHGRQFVCRARA